MSTDIIEEAFPDLSWLQQVDQAFFLLHPPGFGVLGPLIEFVGQEPQPRAHSHGEFPALLTVISVVHPGHVFDEAQPGKLGPCSLQRPPGDMVAILQIGQGRNQVPSLLKGQEDSRRRVPLVPVAGKEYLYQVGDIVELSNLPMLEVNLRRFGHFSSGPFLKTR
jgi:hypothetical protein